MLRDSLVMLKAILKEVSWFLVATPAERRHRKAGPMHLWKSKRDFQIRFLKEVGLKPEHYLLDIGCGTLRGGIPIIEYLEKGHYFGVESRADVLAEGRKELHEANLEDKEPVLIVSENLSSLDIGVTFDYIWAFSVLIHMTDEILNDCLCFVNQHLKNSGAFYANVGIGPRRDARWRWQRFPVVWRTWEFCREVSLRNSLHVTDMGTLESLGDVSGIRSIDEQRMLKFHRI